MSTTLERPVVPPATESNARPRLAVRLGFPADVWPARESIVVIVVVGIALTIVWQLWNLRTSIPLYYSGDALVHGAWIRNLGEGGWYHLSPRTGAPAGGNLADFPMGGEALHFAALKILGSVMPWGAVMNVYFLGSYFSVALSAYFVARYLRLSAIAALVSGVLFSFLPFHEARGEAHLLRSNYYAIPLVVLVVLWLVDWRTELFRVDGDGRRRLRRGRAGFMLGLAALLGVSDTQHVLYACVLLAVVGLVGTCAGRDLRPGLAVVAFAIVAFGTLVVANVPYLLQRFEHGSNGSVAQRSAREQEAFGLRVADLVLPTAGHRISPLAELTDESREQRLSASEEGQGLGVLGVVGLGVALWYVTRRLFARVVPDGTELPTRLGGLALVAILTATIGGFSYLLSLGGLTLYRTWNRMSIIVACCALLALGWALDRLLARVRRRSSGRAVDVAVAVAAVVLIAVGVFDQTTDLAAGGYEERVETFQIDADFVAAVEATAPRGGMVFQYPIVRYPEVPAPVDMTPSGQLIGYLHSDALRWSFGGTKGRPEADWQENLRAMPPPAQIAVVAAVGFDGVMVNRDGYADEGAEIEGALGALGAALDVESRDGRLAYYGLERVREGLVAEFGERTVQRYGTLALRVPTASWERGAYALEETADGTYRWLRREATLEITDADGAELLRVRASTLVTPASSLVAEAGAERQEVRGESGAQQIDLTVPGADVPLAVTFMARGEEWDAGPDTRHLWVRLWGLSITDERLVPLEDFARCRAGDDAACASGG